MGRFALSNCGDTLAYGPGVFPFSVCEAILAIETGRVWASPTVLGLWASPTGVELWALPTEVVFLTPSTEVSGWDFVFITIVQFMMSSNIICLFVYDTISLSSLCKLIWRHWTYKMPVRYILSSVWVRLSIFSQLSILQYTGLCVFGLPCDDWDDIYFVLLSASNRKYELLVYYQLFRARSWNNGMRCMSIFLLYYFWDSQHSIKNSYIK